MGAAHGDASGAEEEGGCLASSPTPCLQAHAEEEVGDLEGIEVRVGCLVAESALHDDGCIPECHQPHSKGMHLCTAPVPHFPRMNWI